MFHKDYSWKFFKEKIRGILLLVQRFSDELQEVFFFSSNNGATTSTQRQNSPALKCPR